MVFLHKGNHLSRSLTLALGLLQCGALFCWGAFIFAK